MDVNETWSEKGTEAEEWEDIVEVHLPKIKTEANMAAIVTYLMPIVAVSIGVIDGENINSIQLLGMVLIILGVFISGEKN